MTVTALSVSAQGGSHFVAFDCVASDDVAFDDVAFDDVAFDFVALMMLRFVSTEMRQLDDYIKHYEEHSYITQNLHNKHMRAKRSTGSKSLDLKFKAHSR